MSITDEFEVKRNNLLELLDEALIVNEELLKSNNLNYLGEANQRRIEQTKSNCKENLFSVALIAPFQTGKSTTTAAFADGQEISPRGLGGGGIKTSACIINVHNSLSNDKLAKIEWRTKQDLSERILEVLHGTLITISHKAEISTLDISDKGWQQLLKQAISVELALYEENQKNYDNNKLELLKCIMLIVNHYNNPTLQKMMQKEYYTIEEVNKYIQFPRNLNEKWEKLDPLNFTLAEAMYVFIKSVIIPTTSKFLEKTGTAIIDAPGLFISVYDDMLAKEAMYNSSAIFYLFSGDKQLSQEDEKALTLIRDAGFDNKVFFGVNYTKNPKLIQSNDGVGNSILSRLRTLGFSRPHQKELLYFNAFLAMRGAQGKQLLEGTLDKHTRDCIVKDAEKSQLPASSVEEAWLESTIEVMQVVRAEGAKEAYSLGLCPRTVELVIKASNWNETIDIINGYVFSHKARAALVDQGCQPIIDMLDMTEEDLSAKEIEAEQDVAAREQQYKIAKERLNQFINQSRELKNKYITDRWDTALVNDYYDNVLLPVVKNVAKLAAPEIAEEVGVLSTIGDVGKKAFDKVKHFFTGEGAKFEFIEQRCVNIVKKHFDNELDTQSKKWMGNLEENQVYISNVKNDVVELMERVKDKWNLIKINNDIFNRLSKLLPKMSGELKKDMKSPRISMQALNQMKNAKLLDSFADAGIFIGGVLAFGYVYCFVMPLDFIIPGAGVILAAMAMGLVKLVQAITGQKGKLLQKMAQQMESNLIGEINNHSKEIKQNLVNGKGDVPGLSFIRNYYNVAYEAQLIEMQNKLANDEESTLEQFQKSHAARERVANEAKKIREQKIKPMQSRIEAFYQDVNNLWPEIKNEY